MSLRAPRHRMRVSRVRPAPHPTPHQPALTGSANASWVIVELSVEPGTLMEPTAQQIAEVCAQHVAEPKRLSQSGAPRTCLCVP